MPENQFKLEENPVDTLYIVVPCYNEEAVLHETARQLSDKLRQLMAEKRISDNSKIAFVNDGSADKTWEIISKLHESDAIFLGINLTKNCGHQNALLAGLMVAKSRCDMAISMDADLQHNIAAINEMLEAYYNGCDIVYAVRASMKAETAFKRLTSRGFYRLMSWLGAKTIPNHADYRLMSRKALEGLAQFKEVNLFLRGIVPMIGYQSAIVEYEQCARFAGESKYTLKKMVSFALEGITSLSIQPVRYITLLGLLTFVISMGMLAYTVISWWIGRVIAGWSSVMCSVWAIGGLILLALGIIGEYIGKVYLEAKARPRYFIREILEDNNGEG